MKAEDVKELTVRSDELLKRAVEDVEEAEKLDEGNAKREWLLEQAASLISRAREITAVAKKRAS